MTVIHLKTLALAAPALVLAQPALADCTDLQDCLKSANTQLIRTAETMGPPDCTNRTTGCVVVRKNNDESGPEIKLPDSAAFIVWPLNDGDHYTMYGRLGSRLPPVFVDAVEGLTGDNGMTVAVQFRLSAETNTGRQGLFTLGESDVARMAISADRRHLFFGTVSSASGKWTDIPLWDPKPTGSGWYTLFATFTDSGQLLIELLDNSPDDNAKPQRLTSGRLDFGWPITGFPKRFESKTFLKVNRLSLGEPNSGLIDGFAKMMVFKRPLTEGERRAIAASSLKSNPIKFDDPTLACNTGTYLNDKPKAAGTVHTVCGNRESPLAATELPGSYRLWQSKNLSTYYATVTLAAGDVFMSYKNTIFTNEQKITFESLGSNFFRVHTDRGPWQVSGDKVVPGTVSNNPNQIWHIHQSQKGLQIRSALTGTLAGAVVDWHWPVVVRRNDSLWYSDSWTFEKDAGDSGAPKTLPPEPDYDPDVE